MRSARRRAGHVARAAGLLAAGMAVLGACGSYPGATEQGRSMHHLYNQYFVAATVVFVLVEGAIVFAALRWRRRDDALPPQFHGNTLLEVLWTAAPMALVAFLFVVSYQVLQKVQAEAANPDVRIVVEAFQWQWNFIYQDEKVTVEPGQPPEALTVKGSIPHPPELVLPVGRKIHFTEQSKDVIHSFYIPAFLFKKDVFPDPNHRNTFDLTIDRPGVYAGQCAQFCGLSHNDMHFTIRALPPAQYAAWLAKAKRQAASGCPADATPGQIAAKNVAFDKSCLASPAGKPFTLTFHNLEAVPHNVVIFQGRTAAAPPLPATPPSLVVSNATHVYKIPALKSGRYLYHCAFHPAAMQGQLVVK